MTRAQSILFVCLGNICRSPTAEGVVRAKAAARGRVLTLDSAGTGDWHLGAPPYGPMQAAARARGYDLSDLRARQVCAEDFQRFDLILAMDAQNLADLRALRGQGGADVRLFTDVLSGAGDGSGHAPSPRPKNRPDPKPDHVPDPYYTRDFNGTLDLIEDCADALLDQL